MNPSEELTSHPGSGGGEWGGGWRDTPSLSNALTARPHISLYKYCNDLFRTITTLLRNKFS